MNPLNRRIIDQWHHIAQSGDFTDLDTMIHDDAVFESPIVHTPQRGKAITIKYLAAAVTTLKVQALNLSANGRATSRSSSNSNPRSKASRSMVST
jgi:hypothetical protein